MGGGGYGSGTRADALTRQPCLSREARMAWAKPLLGWRGKG
jgi:hypothetical protein